MRQSHLNDLRMSKITVSESKSWNNRSIKYVTEIVFRSNKRETYCWRNIDSHFFQVKSNKTKLSIRIAVRLHDPHSLSCIFNQTGSSVEVRVRRYKGNSVPVEKVARWISLLYRDFPGRQRFAARLITAKPIGFLHQGVWGYNGNQ